MSAPELHTYLVDIATDVEPVDLYDRTLRRSRQIRRRRRTGTALAAIVAAVAIGGLTWQLLPRTGPDPVPPAWTTTVPSLTPVPTTAAATTPPSATPTATPLVDAQVLGPFGFGALRLGMTKAEAAATGLTVGVDPSTPATCGGDGDGYLIGSPDANIGGKLFFKDESPAGSASDQSDAGTLIAIYAYPGVETPEGIGIGSTLAEVRQAYPSWRDVVGGGTPGEEADGRGSAAVPGNPDAHYRIAMGSGTVAELSLDSNRPGCYE